MQKYTKETAETLAVLRNTGYVWNIETVVDRKVELHRMVERLNGRVEIHFVAEVDSYGNVSEWGLFGHEPNHRDRRDFFLNPEGEIVKAAPKKR